MLPDDPYTILAVAASIASFIAGLLLGGYLVLRFFDVSHVDNFGPERDADLARGWGRPHFEGAALGHAMGRPAQLRRLGIARDGS